MGLSSLLPPCVLGTSQGLLVNTLLALAAFPLSKLILELKGTAAKHLRLVLGCYSQGYPLTCTCAFSITPAPINKINKADFPRIFLPVMET